MSSRYSPSSPRALTEADIHSIPPSEIQATCDQLDQGTIVILQQIDENFAKANQVLNERILPGVQRHGENSQQIWESIKFWRSFFESAANTKLSEPGYGEPSFVDGTEHGITVGGGEEVSLGGLEDNSIDFGDDASSSVTTTPRAATGWEHDTSPYQALEEDLRQFGISSNQESNRRDMAQSVQEVQHHQQQRLRLNELAPDSPDFPSPPRMESDLSNFGHAGGRVNYQDISMGSPVARGGANPPPASARAGQSALLQNLFRKNLASKPPSSSTSTPALGRLQVPKEIPSQWDGITDLAHTPLGSLISPMKRRQPTAAVGPNPGASPELSPPSMLMTLPPNPYSKTPTKEAARGMARNAYHQHEEESPMMEPPSVLKNWASRGYDSMAPEGEGLRRGFEEEEEMGLEEGESYEEEGPVPFVLPARTTSTTALKGRESFEERISTTSRQDEAGEDLHPAPQQAFTAGIIDEEEEGHFGSFDLGDTGTGEYLLGEEDESFQNEALAGGAGGGAEETLFGFPQRPEQESEDSFDMGGGGGRQFNMLGKSDMDTLYGGEILESEPFEASPLARRGQKEY